MSNVEMSVKNPNFCQKKQNFVKNPNFCWKSKYWWKIKCFVKNLNSCQKSNVLSKLEILLKNLKIWKLIFRGNFSGPLFSHFPVTPPPYKRTGNQFWSRTGDNFLVFFMENIGEFPEKTGRATKIFCWKYRSSFYTG